VQIPVQQTASGLSVLLVEDEPLIAMDGEAVLKDLGGAAGRAGAQRGRGIERYRRRTASAALLDLRLGAETSLPLAERLAELGVPFAFLTGYQGDAIRRSSGITWSSPSPSPRTSC